MIVLRKTGAVGKTVFWSVLAVAAIAAAREVRSHDISGGWRRLPAPAGPQAQSCRTTLNKELWTSMWPL